MPSGKNLFSQSFTKPDGTKKLLLVNKVNENVTVALPTDGGGRLFLVDPSSVGMSSAVRTQAMTISQVTLPACLWFMGAILRGCLWLQNGIREVEVDASEGEIELLPFAVGVYVLAT